MAESTKTNESLENIASSEYASASPDGDESDQLIVRAEAPDPRSNVCFVANERRGNLSGVPSGTDVHRVSTMRRNTVSPRTVFWLYDVQGDVASLPNGFSEQGGHSVDSSPASVRRRRRMDLAELLHRVLLSVFVLCSCRRRQRRCKATQAQAPAKK